MTMPTRGQKQSVTGEAAYRKITSKLGGYSATQQLAREVYDFYGEHLGYVESRDISTSCFNIDLQHEPTLFLKLASVELQLGTDRTAEALAHELLHLQLPILGFPIGEKVDIPEHLDKFGTDFLEIYSKIGNLVEHEIIIESFIALGFSKKRFLGNLVPPIDYRQLVLNTLPKEVYVPEIGFYWFCLEYFRHWITIRHSNDPSAAGFAQSALEWGARLHPELKQIAAEMIGWVESGNFKQPDQYSQQFNFLLELMRVPKYTGWVVLKRGEQRKPIAIRLE
jgi:hypothetical protein